MAALRESRVLFYTALAFAVIYFLPVDAPVFRDSVLEGLSLLKWYAQEHVILCLIPAFFIAGAITVFIRQESVIRYFGATSRKWISYSVASISGSVLAVCSCTVLPLFAGIYKRGASIGPAIAFLYSGPAINILAIILTARILGIELGIARVVGAVSFSVVIGLTMSLIYSKEEIKESTSRDPAKKVITQSEGNLFSEFLYFASMTGILVFANWGSPSGEGGFFGYVYEYKWIITSAFALMFAVMMVKQLGTGIYRIITGVIILAILSAAIPEYKQLIFLIMVLYLGLVLYQTGGPAADWLESSLDYFKQIMPLLAAGVFISGMLLGSAENKSGLIPGEWITAMAGGNSITANLFASAAGALMYFATLTEVPILQGLLNSGMGKGPALALLLAGPALSLPSMLVIKSVIGLQKTVVYVLLVIFMSTIAGMIFGSFF